MKYTLTLCVEDGVLEQKGGSSRGEHLAGWQQPVLGNGLTVNWPLDSCIRNTFKMTV